MLPASNRLPAQASLAFLSAEKHVDLHHQRLFHSFPFSWSTFSSSRALDTYPTSQSSLSQLRSSYVQQLPNFSSRQLPTNQPPRPSSASGDLQNPFSGVVENLRQPPGFSLCEHSLRIPSHLLLFHLSYYQSQRLREMLLRTETAMDFETARRVPWSMLERRAASAPSGTGLLYRGSRSLDSVLYVCARSWRSGFLRLASCPASSSSFAFQSLARTQFWPDLVSAQNRNWCFLATRQHSLCLLQPLNEQAVSFHSIQACLSRWLFHPRADPPTSAWPPPHYFFEFASWFSYFKLILKYGFKIIAI